MSFAYSQSVSGVITDRETGETLFGANVVIKGTSTGTTTDFDGRFTLRITQELPAEIEVIYLGYVSQTITISENDLNRTLRVRMVSSAEGLGEVEVVESRITDRLRESALTIESMSLAAIKETPAASFYEGLGNMKGVDMTTASLGFVIINTRGFNSTSPVRSLQLVDGADNQAPGLNFSLGNFVGSSELDIQRVELIQGASTAFYGPNAFNGVINMYTRNPFFHPGLSVMVKGGERNLFETAVRYARVFRDSDDEDKFAFKLNFSFLRADDWEAENYNPTDQSLKGPDNPGGYDAVNVYGDENFREQTNNFETFSGLRNYPGLGVFYRTGYREIDVVDYDIRNIKAGASLHYKLTRDIEANYSYNYGAGTTVYQGDNRYSLKNLQFQQHRVEVSKPNRFFVRAYTTLEDAGDSYDAVFTALLLQQEAKNNNAWNQDYISYWSQNIVNRVRNLPDFPGQGNWWFGDTRDSTVAVAQNVLNTFQDSIQAWHEETRAFADGIGNPLIESTVRFEPGTAEFDSMFNQITSESTLSEGGTRFYDKSKLYHVQGEYKFNPGGIADLRVGGSYRLYAPDSDGTIFSDTAGVVIRNYEYGVYAGAERRFIGDRLILSAAARLDKNQNFGYQVSPAASAVYSRGNHTLRFSFSSAIRNPTLQDQYLFYNVGRAILLGNLGGKDSIVTTESLIDYVNTRNPDTLDYFNVAPIVPEKVRTLEIGYRGTVLNNFYVDMSAYMSLYRDFIGYNIGAEVDFDESTGFITQSQVYRIAANATDEVLTYGTAIGFNYYFRRYYSLNGNYSWNRLNLLGSDDPIVPAFNTPEHKFNIGVSARDLVLRFGDRVTLRNIGFNVNYKWVQGFLFEGSPQFTGFVPTYGLLDAQINYTHKPLHTTFKIGASNLLNNKHYQTYGGPYIGRLAYISITFENPGL
ncbi:MAG: TonB-dependent receptor [Chitinophagaceae bacterium]|nr:MAG: TonB-dependent receptor [Chitinophagaceae bacterium]